MLYFDIFGLEFQKSIVLFEISTLKFLKLQNLMKKMKMHKFVTKNALFMYFAHTVLKKYCHI